MLSDGKGRLDGDCLRVRPHRQAEVLQPCGPKPMTTGPGRRHAFAYSPR